MQTRSGREKRRGIALAVALLGIVVIGALVAGAYFVSMQEFRLGNNEFPYPRALAVAEYGQDTLFAGWSRSWGGMRRGDTAVRVFSGSNWADTVRATKLNQHMFYLVSTGQAASASGVSAQRRTGFLVRLRYPDLKVRGALTTRGGYQGQSQTYNGNDQAPTGWGAQCDAPAAPIAGIASNQNPNLQTSTVTGTPSQTIGPEMADTNTYFNYGPYKWANLVAMATKTLSTETVTGGAPTWTGTVCNTGDPKNFGEPDHTTPSGPCDNYFPVVYRNGNLTMQNTQGQGILLVTGNLQFQDTRWYGLVIVRGKFQTQDQNSPGTTVQGALMAANLPNEAAQSQGGKFLYSSCAIQMAMQQYVVTERLRQRAWAELF